MQTATINVKYVNQPKSPKGPGSVKDADGIYWKVWPDTLGRFQADQSYTVGYTTEKYQGKDQYTIKEVLAGAGAPAAPSPAPQQPIPAYQTPPHPQQQPIPSTAKDINISVLALAKPYIELGQVPIEELESLLVKVKAIVQRVL